MRASELNVKRDLELGRDEVRVMTVHGAKGLEADIVFLADTTGKPGTSHEPKIFEILPPNSPVGTPPRLVWSPGSKADVPLVETARLAHRAAQEEEYRRLLYVAMTRAADRLIICGARSRKTETGVWYDMIDAALGAQCVEEEADDGEGPVKRWRRGTAVPAIREAVAATAIEAPPLPAILTRDAPPVPLPLRTITPSGLGKETAVRRMAPEAAANREAAIRRGTLIHRLLQSLPDVAPEGRAAAAERFLRAQTDLHTDLQGRYAAEALRLMEDARLAPLFGPGSRAEVPVAGRIGGRPVSGQIDRLVVTAERIIIADFKTNDPAPRHADGVPPAYVAQLALYRALLARIHPGVPVEAWLIWTTVPDVMAIETARLDAAFAELGLG